MLGDSLFVKNKMSYQELGPKFALAIDKGHNIVPDEVSFLKRAGFDFLVWENGNLHVVVENDNFLRSTTLNNGEDIPNRLDEGVADFGIFGRDVLIEAQLTGIEVEEVVRLNMSHCRVVVEVPIYSSYSKPKDLDGMRIATRFPNHAREYFSDYDAEIRTVKYSGGEEAAVAQGAADAVMAIYRSGTTMGENGLRLIGGIITKDTPKDEVKRILTRSTIIESQALLVASTEFLNEHGSDRIVRQFINRVRQTAGTRAVRRVVRLETVMPVPEFILVDDPPQIPQIA